MTLLLVLPFAVAAIGWFYAVAPRTTASWVTDGDSDRVRRADSVEPYRDGEVLPVMKENP